MKKYIKPEVEITKFDVEDIVMTSAITPQQTIEVDGVIIDAVGYDAQPFSIFD